MAILRDIPQPNDIIAVSQPELLANNQGYVDTFAVDHVAYNAPNAGYHNQSTYPSQLTPPVGESTSGRVFTQPRSTVPGTIDLFYRYQNDGGTDYQNFILPLTQIRAFGKAGSGAGPVAGSSYNVASTSLSGDTWTINFSGHITDNIIPANLATAIVLLSPESSAPGGSNSNHSCWYTLVTTLQMKIFRSDSTISGVSFMVMAL